MWEGHDFEAGTGCTRLINIYIKINLNESNIHRNKIIFLTCMKVLLGSKMLVASMR